MTRYPIGGLLAMCANLTLQARPSHYWPTTDNHANAAIVTVRYDVSSHCAKRMVSLLGTFQGQNPGIEALVVSTGSKKMTMIVNEGGIKE